jgi:solute carrier family 9 (sodium/hydrogen exchanger), member 6/7
MLEIMGIQTGVVEEVDSDDEFDIEIAANGTYYKRGGTAFGHTPTRSDFHLKLNNMNGRQTVPASPWEDSYSSGSNRPSPPARPSNKRHNSTHSQREREEANRTLLNRDQALDDDDFFSDSDLPPAAPRRSPKRRPSPPPEPARGRTSTYPTSGTANPPGGGSSSENHITAREVIKDFFTGKEDHAEWFKRLDDAVIKPTLLLDQNDKGTGPKGNGNGNGNGSGAGGGA